ncbi:hypothetical protein BH10PSE19_BH10PSE19_02370 [soil metagenome]
MLRASSHSTSVADSKAADTLPLFIAALVKLHPDDLQRLLTILTSNKSAPAKGILSSASAERDPDLIKIAPLVNSTTRKWVLTNLTVLTALNVCNRTAADAFEHSLSDDKNPLEYLRGTVVNLTAALRVLENELRNHNLPTLYINAKCAEIRVDIKTYEAKITVILSHPTPVVADEKKISASSSIRATLSSNSSAMTSVTPTLHNNNPIPRRTFHGHTPTAPEPLSQARTDSRSTGPHSRATAHTLATPLSNFGISRTQPHSRAPRTAASMLPPGGLPPLSPSTPMSF